VHHRIWPFVVAWAAIASSGAAQDHASHAGHADVAAEAAPAEHPSVEPTRPGLMLMPIRPMIPGTWSTPGGFHVMANIAAIGTNPGFANAYDSSLGRTHPYVLADWIMAQGRTANGYFEGLLMLNFEPLTLGREGWAEVGQAGEGLLDAQHSHQLLHQAIVALHLLGRDEGPLRIALWGGQGSATIGPPLFMHRASNPSPTVPRKHHKGENPHETLPVVGLTVEYARTALDLSWFNAREPLPDDRRFYPKPRMPKSFAARIRQRIGELVELQVSAARLIDQGEEEDATQLSASVYGRWVGPVVIDALLDGAVDLPAHAEEGHGKAAAGLGEIAVRDPSLRDIGWTRLEVNERVEPTGGVSSPWWFASLGYERTVWVDPASVLSLGLFGELTWVRVPASMVAAYGDRDGVTATMGLHGALMWMGGAAAMSHGGMAH
jgi:hypothetical protein